jgi:hypothetical protein
VLIDNEIVPLRTVTELTLRKPTNLPKVEMTRGVEHVSKVPKEVKSKSLRGKVIYIHVQIIMRSQNYNLASKILDTKCNHKYVEKQNAYLSSWLLIWEIFLKQWAKDIISDSLSGTGDPLNLAIGIRVLTSGTLISFGLFFAIFEGETSKGDGVIVVPSIIRREGSQETVFNKDRTSIGKTIHSTPRPLRGFLRGKILRTKTLDYNSRYAIHSKINTQGTRNISNKSDAVASAEFRKSSKAQATSLKGNLGRSLNPGFFTGFTDGEGSFMVSIIKVPKLRVGWRVVPVFQIGQPRVELLNNIQAYLGGCGFITKQSNNCLAFKIFSLKQFDKLLYHFEQYPLQTKKRADFLLFKDVILKMKNGKHLEAEGLQDIINIRATLNRGLTPLLEEAFPGCIPVPRPLVENPQIPDPYWVAGFTSGEGCFTINITKSSASKTGFLVNLRFQVSQHSRDEELIRSFIGYMGCGRYYSLKGSQLRGDFVVTSLPDILNKINPFFRNYPIIGVKSKDFQSWSEAAELMRKKEHLKVEGLEKIRKIKASINKASTSEARFVCEPRLGSHTQNFNLRKD